MHQRELAILERGVMALEQIARTLTMYGRKTVAELDDLVAAVKANDNTEASAVQAIQGLGAKLADAISKEGGIPDDVKAKLVELTTDINNNSASLAAAITANTPADPAKEGAPSGSVPAAGSTETAPKSDAGPQAGTGQ